MAAVSEPPAHDVDAETAVATVTEQFDTAFAATAIAPSQEPAPAVLPASDPAGRFVVQAAAFSTADRARRAAEVLEGSVSQSGAYFRVRTGPFATRTEAEAALAKVRDAGYSDARIFTNG